MHHVTGFKRFAKWQLAALPERRQRWSDNGNGILLLGDV